MRIVAIIFLLLLCKYCSAQGSVQKYLQTEEINSPEVLAQLLTATDTTDRQKVISIFSWITQNISYNVKRFENTNASRYATVPDEEDDDEAAPLKPLYERIAILVLKRRTAVCSGYANLFKSMCVHVGIPCEVITGLGKSNAGRLDKRFTSNHRWNAVFFDTVWHLLDVTWASGYINNRNEFQREYNPHYFLTAPGEFINDHYPEDVRWTLLLQPHY
jgi:transglutaminase/protease-like cytokinesis protein 3